MYRNTITYLNSTTPSIPFSEAKERFQKAFLDYYGQIVDEISEENSLYINGSWIFNSPLWTSNNKTVTNYGRFRDRQQQKHQPFGAEFDTLPSNPPTYPG